MQVKEIETVVDGIVHADTQRHEAGFDLTAAEIYDLTDPGRIDFGGGELDPATTDPVETTKRNPDDDYAWWHLDPGTYVLEYNEFLTIDGDERLLIQPRDALLAQGVVHPTLATSELPKMPLTVGAAGARIKENARVSTLVPV